MEAGGDEQRGAGTRVDVAARARTRGQQAMAERDQARRSPVEVAGWRGSGGRSEGRRAGGAGAAKGAHWARPEGTGA